MRKKKEVNECATPGCTRMPRKRMRFCSTCDKQNWRRKYPMKAAYSTLKDNSTRRGIYFDLTFEEFVEFCYEYDYMAGKGRSAKSYTVDRKIEGKKPGYTRDNIQCLPKGVNSQKEHARRKNKLLVYDWETKSAIYIDKDSSSVHDNDNPF